MTDIPALIERGAQALHRRNGFVPWEKVTEPAREAYRKDVLAILEESGALSLTVSPLPLPEEIAGLIEHAAIWENKILQEQPFIRLALATFIDKLAAALERMGREIIRLTEPSNPPLTMNDALALLAAQGREIGRLQAERDTTATDLFDRCQDLTWDNERDQLLTIAAKELATLRARIAELEADRCAACKAKDRTLMPPEAEGKEE